MCSLRGVQKTSSESMPKEFSNEGHSGRTGKKDQTATGAVSGMVAMGVKVVMQTALVSVGCNDKLYETRAFFDTGSNRTNITEELAKMLKAKLVKQRTISVYSFGSTEAKQKTSPVVDLAITIKVGKLILIKATVTPHITGPLKQKAIQLRNQRKIQKDYPLADTLPKNTQTCTIRLLIANDYYNDLILVERNKIQDNLYINNLKFGWIISGRVSSTNGNEKENVMFAMTQRQVVSQLIFIL